MYDGEPSPTCSCYNNLFSVELTCPVDDFRELLDIEVKCWDKTRTLRSQALSERAHMLRKKWLPTRPKKVRWRKG